MGGTVVKAEDRLNNWGKQPWFSNAMRRRLKKHAENIKKHADELKRFAEEELKDA
tara:strand:- start:801 stop:965 length:165 start_codon:yes stop_codon:yes gene_type:complete